MAANMATSAAELKTQAAVEMARDPNSSVTSDDAQKKMVEESHKAGVAAFTFDPNATPAQKAAQARAVSSSIAYSAVIIQANYSFPSMCQTDSTMNTNQRLSQSQQI
jgi:hypothetical protein